MPRPGPSGREDSSSLSWRGMPVAVSAVISASVRSRSITGYQSRNTRSRSADAPRQSHNHCLVVALDLVARVDQGHGPALGRWQAMDERRKPIRCAAPTPPGPPTARAGRDRCRAARPAPCGPSAAGSPARAPASRIATELTRRVGGADEIEIGRSSPAPAFGCQHPRDPGPELAGLARHGRGQIVAAGAGMSVQEVDRLGLLSHGAERAPRPHA